MERNASQLSIQFAPVLKWFAEGPWVLGTEPSNWGIHERVYPTSLTRATSTHLVLPQPSFEVFVLLGREVGVLPGLGAFWLIGGSEFHNETHDAFMTLPPYTRIREGEVHQLEINLTKSSSTSAQPPSPLRIIRPAV
jgi:hypothetical protein